LNILDLNLKNQKEAKIKMKKKELEKKAKEINELLAKARNKSFSDRRIELRKILTNTAIYGELERYLKIKNDIENSLLDERSLFVDIINEFSDYTNEMRDYNAKRKKKKKNK